MYKKGVMQKMVSSALIRVKTIPLKLGTKGSEATNLHAQIYITFMLCVYN